MSPEMLKQKYPIMARLPDDSEGCLTLCASHASVKRPTIAFVRLAEGRVYKKALEIPIPLRFVFVVITPKPSPNIDA